MSDSMEAAEGFTERLLPSDDSLDRHFLLRARRIAAAVYLAVDESEDDAKALMRDPAEMLVARLRSSLIALAITEGTSLEFMSKQERASILAMLEVAVR
jgi:hypothetical protein